MHVHASSPCTDLSCARGASVTPDDIARGVSMLRWCLDLVLARGDQSWSIENVSTITTREMLADYAARFPTHVAYASIDACDYGACQTRTRLIAGPPGLIRKLQEMPSARRVSVREAFITVGLQVPATHFKNQTRSRAGGPCMRSVEELSFTVCASHALTWCSAGGETTRVMTARESAVLMGFPMSWRLPQGSRAAQRAVGNALCVLMSKAIVQAAISILSGEPVPALPLPTTTSPTEPSVTPWQPHPQTTVNGATKDKDHQKLCKRVRSLESVVMDLQRHCLARMAGMARGDESLKDSSGSE